jgi:hypothetical protein
MAATARFFRISLIAVHFCGYRLIYPSKISFSESAPWVSFGQLVHHFVQVPDLPHQRELDLFHPDATHFTWNQSAMGTHSWDVTKKVAVAGVGLSYSPAE